MNISEVILYLESLVAGIDPQTHQAITDDSIVLAFPVRTALATAASILRGQYSEAPDWNVTRAGDRWSNDEDIVLRAEHKSGLTVREIAKAHRRSEGSIQSRMIKLGIIVCDSDGSASGVPFAPPSTNSLHLYTKMSDLGHLEKFNGFEDASRRAKELAREFHEITSIDRLEDGWAVLVSPSVISAISENVEDSGYPDDYYTVADLASDCGWR